MKIEKTKPKKGVSELPLIAKELIDKLQTCSDDELVSVLWDVAVWRYGKCELYHWVDVLDRFDEILEEAATSKGDPTSTAADSDCIYMCPKLSDHEFKRKVVTVLNFTALLIEHSYARHIYNSTEHLFALLGCPDLDVVLAVLNLFYVFSKRSNFISRLPAKKRSCLNSYLEYLGETWGGKQSGFGLAECCRNIDIKLFPSSCTSVYFKYQPVNGTVDSQSGSLFKSNTSSQSIVLENIDQVSESIPELMKRVTSVHKVPLQLQMQLLSRVRLAKNFPDYVQRLKCILARLQALSILVYSVVPAEIVDPLIYDGFVEELVEVLECKEPGLMEIKAAVLRTLTAIIHLERDPKLAAIVESTGASAYHGFLPTLVRDCVASFTSSGPAGSDFPLSFNTALFSFLYHLATYETSGDALVTSGIMESLLQVLDWKAFEPMNITLVTRAVRVIDLVTGLDMSAFHSLGGWDKMLLRLEMEVGKCREETPLVLSSELKPARKKEQASDEATPMDTSNDDPSMDVVCKSGESMMSESSCMPERAALIKSILNFLKKAIPEPTFAENIRNFVSSSLPQSLKHIVSNAEYYGPSIYLPATEVTTVFIFHEPSQLSSLQDNGLPGVVLNSVITKQIPATREVLSSLPNILSAMCLNTRGLQSFIAAEPFDHLFSVLVSPEYLPAMRKKKGTDQVGDTASSLGVAMDELMRHQPALRINVIAALIRLLKLLVDMGSTQSTENKEGGVVKSSSQTEGRRVSIATKDPLGEDHMSADSDVDEDDDEEESDSGDLGDGGGEGGAGDSPSEDAGSEKTAQPLTEYFVNVIRFLDAILTNNSTKDHTTEFIKQGGLKPMIKLLSLPSLPLDFPSSHGFNAITNACRGILHLAQPSELLGECLGQLSSVMADLAPFLDSPQAASSSVLLEEVGPLTNVPEAIKSPQATPLLHKLAIANGFLQLFVYIFKACHSAYVVETREACLKQFSSPTGKVVLQQLSKLYKALVWEGFILLAVAADKEKRSRTQTKTESGTSISMPKDSCSGHQVSSSRAQDEQGSTATDFSAVETMDTSAPLPTMPSGELTQTGSTGLASNEVVSKLSLGGVHNKKEQPWLLVESLKHLTPLLTITSRVGRSLAELMNLLIRIAITPLIRNPHRRERYRDDIYVPTSEDALQICDEVTLLLVDSLKWEVPMPQACSQAMESPIRDWLFAGMTFKMYAVDFCELLLFDEHKQVYNMVLHAFDKRCGLEAYISTFQVALKVINEDEDSTSIYGSCVDFLEAWLNLAEKLLNTPAMISSPHALSIPPHEQMDNKRLVYNPMFNPLEFFVKCQKAILPCLKALWDSPRLSKLTTKVIELLLVTIRHYYQSGEPMAEKLEEYIAADKRDDPLSQLARVRAEMEAEDRANREKGEREREEAARREREANEPPAPPRVDPHHLQQLCDMGFTRAHAEEALEACGNDLNAAMEWILTHPSSESQDPSMEGLSEEEQISKAIALSLVQEETKEQKEVREKEEAKKKEEEEEKEKLLAEEKEKEYDVLRAMDKSVLDDFSDVLFPSSIELAATVPDCVCRVCDLIVNMAKRNGDEWWHRGIERFKNNVLQSVEKLTQDILSGSYVKPKIVSMDPLACQLQLLSLIMEEMPVSCANIVCEPNFLAMCLQLLEAAQNNIDSLCTDPESSDSTKLQATPKWLQSLLILLDIWGKTIKTIKWWRPLRDDCIVVWQWFENSRWCSYSHDLGQCLEKSYLDGNHCYSVRSSGRSRYESFRNIVLFDSMLQANTETNTVRPVLRIEVARNSRRYKSKEELAKEVPVPPYEINIHDDGSAAPSTMTEDQTSVTLKYCIRLLSAPIDPDTLNATMRLCLRITRQACGGAQFVKAGGPQLLLSLKSKSGFKGFSALALNIFRHCFEDEQTMKRTMEDIIKYSMTTPSSNVKEVKPQGNGMKDFNYVLRRLAPIACRDEDLFTEQATTFLRVTSKIPRPESYFVSQRPSPTYLKCLGPLKVTEAPLTHVHISLINLLLDHLCSDSFPGDPFSKVNCNSEEGKIEDVKDAKVFRGTRRTGSRGTTYRRQQTTGTFEDDDDDLTMDGDENLSLQASSSGGPTASSSPTEEAVGLTVDTEKKEIDGSKVNERPLLSKAATLKFLAEVLDSYPQCAKTIVESSRLIKLSGEPAREMNLLAFIFDYLIPCSSNPNSRVQNVAKLAKSFVYCIATSNFMPDVITTLVVEFKAAFSRALVLPESQSKHNRLRSLMSLLSLVTDYNVLVSRGPVNPGQFARLLIRKGLISDMTRAVHYLDLTSPLLHATMNSILKPLEALTRIVNQVATTSRQRRPPLRTAPTTSITLTSSGPVTTTSISSVLPRAGRVAASAPALLAGENNAVSTSVNNVSVVDSQRTTAGEPTSSIGSTDQQSQDSQERDTDVLDATHESLVPLEEEEEEEEDHSMELDRDHLMDTVASLAHGIGRAHRQRDSGEDMDGQDMVSAADYSTHSGSDGHPGGDFSDVIRGDESIEISDEETDSEDEEGAELLEDGCNSAGEEVEDEEFDDSHLDTSHPVIEDDLESDLSDADSTQDEEEDTEVEEAGDSDDEDDGDSIEPSEDGEEVNLDETGGDDSFSMDLHTTGDVSGDGDMDMSYMEEDEDSDDGEDELELEYDFEDDIGEELDYFVDMPWSSYIGEEGDGHITSGRAAGGASFTRAYHTRPGQPSSTDFEHSSSAFSQSTIPICHPLLQRTADHSSQLVARVRSGSAIPYETPMPIGGTGSQSSNQPESTMHQLLANISVATGNNDGLVYGVGASGAQRIKTSQSSQGEAVGDELESPVIPNALSRWEEVSAVLDGPGAVCCMHEVRDVIKAKWGEVYFRDNPKDSDDEDSFTRRRAARNDASTSTATTTQQETSAATSTTTTTTAVATAPTVPTTTASRLGSEPSTSVPTAPHPSDQVTPSNRSPQDTSSTVDQLRSSLRQVADALAETVAAVRSTREQLLGREEEGAADESRNQESSVEAMETREELETIPEDRIPVQPTPMDSHPDVQIVPVASQPPPSTATSADTSLSTTLPSQDISTASGPTTTTTSSSSAHPIMATFDGSQESAVATLASTNPEDPLYTFLSAVARTPAPPISDSPSTTSTTLPSQTPPTSESSSGVVSPRLPVFSQFQDQSSSGVVTATLSSATEQTPSSTRPLTQSAIRTPVIQHPRSTTSTLSSAVNSRTGTNVPTQRGISAGLLLRDVVHQTQAELTTEVTSGLPVIASQVSPFFSQNPNHQNQNLDQDPTRVATESQLLPTTSNAAPNAIDLTSQMQVSTSSPPSGSQRQSLQSPSPSDTLAPLLISSLQLPSSSSTTVTSTPPTVTLSSVIHDHPHLSTTQASATAATTAGSTNLSSVVSVPITSEEAGPLSISIGSVSSTGAGRPQQGEERQQSSDSQQTPETNSIDPTFLAALPHSIRQEVLAQHRREQRASQPTQEEEEPAAPFQSGISPEFLSALPLSIQNEVMQQERLERIRQQGENADSTDPLDNASFFRNLPSDLRRTILSDLDESVLNHLPEDLAGEARRLHQERESRRRQLQEQRNAFLERMMEEAHIRAEASGAGGGAPPPGGIPPPWSHHSFEAAGLHYAVVNLNPYALIDMPTYRPDRRALAAQAAAKGEPSSKQMLDTESLTCILVLLFLDQNRLHVNRLHRIIKNLCQHVPTRDWILSSLLEIIRKLNLPSVGAPCPMPPMLTPTSSVQETPSCSATARSTPIVVTTPHFSTPHWLNINVNAALGSHAQVFQFEHTGKISTNANVKIHPLATLSICNNVFDLLVFLARQFQMSFLPIELLPKESSRISSEADKEKDQRVVSRFWSMLLRLDGVASRKGKGALKSFQYSHTVQTLSDHDLFETSILGQLISLFSQDIFRDNVSLTDKLLRVLSVAAGAIPKTGLVRRRYPDSSKVMSSSAGPSKVQFTVDQEDVFVDKKASSLINPRLLRTVVSVLISGRCSEDGLDDATSLLTNLSKCSIETRETILVILLEGVRTIGQTLCGQVSTLYDDLLQNMESLVERRSSDDQPQGETSRAANILSGVVLPTVSAPERHVDHSNDLHLPSMVPLTCKGSQQSFFLRMLKVVCQLRESAHSAITTQDKATQASLSTSANQGRTDVTQRPMDVDQTTTAENTKFMLQPLSLQLELEELWSMLSECLDALGKTKDSHAVLVLQPLVEAFFLVHVDSSDELKQTSKKRSLFSRSRTSRLASFHTLGDADAAPDSPAPAPMDRISPVPGTPRAGDSEQDLYAHLAPDVARFLKFAEKHRTVLNQILRQCTVPLSEGPFSVLVQHTRVLDFDIKRRYFRHELDQTDDGMRRDDTVVHIRRDHIFEDSFRELYRRSAEELKGNLYIQFEGEEGQDVGGLLREWYLIIAREMFNPNYALFQLTPGDHVTYIPNPLSHVNPNHLNYFKFIGRVIAKAIYDNKLLDCYFTRSFYKHILGKPVHFTDIEAEDYSFYQGMVYLLEHDYNELGIDLNFTTEVQEFGKTEVKELKPDGPNITVSEANKREYVQLACQMKMTGSIQAQIKSFLEGFYEIIPKNLISIFNEQELELLISGLPTIDIDDLKSNTEYHKYTENSLQIQWFWRALRSCDQADRARFLQFVTGTSKVPLQGFAALEGMNGLQKFQIHRDDRSTDRLPCAHTCFNQLDLPPYPTYDKLNEMLLKAVRECPEGFGLA